MMINNAIKIWGSASYNKKANAAILVGFFFQDLKHHVGGLPLAKYQ